MRFCSQWSSGNCSGSGAKRPRTLSLCLPSRGSERGAWEPAPYPSPHPYCTGQKEQWDLSSCLGKRPSLCGGPTGRPCPFLFQPLSMLPNSGTPERAWSSLERVRLSVPWQGLRHRVVGQNSHKGGQSGLRNTRFCAGWPGGKPSIHSTPLRKRLHPSSHPPKARRSCGHTPGSSPACGPGAPPDPWFLGVALGCSQLSHPIHGTLEDYSDHPSGRALTGLPHTSQQRCRQWRIGKGDNYRNRPRHIVNLGRLLYPKRQCLHQ